MGRNGTKLLLHLSTDSQPLYEILNGFFRYCLVRTRQGLQSLIRMRICLPAQNRLDSFGHDRPTVVQIGIDGLTVEQQLA